MLFRSSFVYGKKKGECWVVLLFRAPGNPGTEKAKSLKQYEYLVEELNKVLKLTDSTFYVKGTNKKYLLEDFKGGNDDEDGAVIRLKELTGLIPSPKTTPVWYNKLNLNTITDTQQKAHFKKKLIELLAKVEGGKFNDTYTWCFPDVKTNQDSKICKSIDSDF